MSELDTILIKYRDFILEAATKAMTGELTEVIPPPDNTTFKQAIEAYIAERETQARIDELEQLKSKRTIVEMDLDMEWPYWCENCTMCLDNEDDKCACISLTKDRLDQLKSNERVINE